MNELQDVCNRVSCTLSCMRHNHTASMCCGMYGTALMLCMCCGVYDTKSDVRCPACDVSFMGSNHMGLMWYVHVKG